MSKSVNTSTMKDIIVLIGIWAITIIVICSIAKISKNPSVLSDPETPTGRFLVNDGEGVKEITHYAIMIDRETGVQYAMIFAGDELVDTVPLENPDGTPYLTVE